MKHIKKHPINDKAQKLSKDIKKQDHSKPASKKKLDADKSLSDPEVSMKVTKPSNKKLNGEKFLSNPTINTKKPNKPSNKNLDGEKFLAEGLNHLKRFNEEFDSSGYQSHWTKFAQWLWEKDFELYGGGEDLHNKFMEVSNDDNLSSEDKASQITNYLDEKWGVYDGYMSVYNYLESLFMDEI
jgi:hypothetical protein